jgi:uncharacterized membrane protein YtjA (UPF0391 family)
MLQAAIGLLLLAIIMGFLAFTGIAMTFASVAKALFVIFFLGFLVLCFYAILTTKTNKKKS